MYTLGIDIGSSSVKLSLLDVAKGNSTASAFHPKQEMRIIAKNAGWAEQQPSDWWHNMKLALKDVLANAVAQVKNALANGEPEMRSGKQELFEQLINLYI
ncbi:MAG: hypothetical protein KAW12_10770 [Candidatus Aminicenantes bacterium]|nr:hypothetical protein [Candidatus Aminicenantes bacterium]